MIYVALTNSLLLLHTRIWFPARQDTFDIWGRLQTGLELGARVLEYTLWTIWTAGTMGPSLPKNGSVHFLMDKTGYDEHQFTCKVHIYAVAEALVVVSGHTRLADIRRPSSRP